MQLEMANLRLQKESDYKSEFLAIMSHELRTPLTSILAFTEVWRENAEEGDVREVMAIREIHDNGQILLQMINNILEAARIEAGKLELCKEPLDILDLIGLTEVTVRPLAEKKGVSLETSVDKSIPIINADFEKVRRIVENLTSNAVKYTDAGGLVHLTARAVDAGGFVEISVRDSGVGIREEHIPYIFDKFVQVDDAPGRRYNGSGLGLAVVKELVAAHGGSIWVESKLGEGSAFTVRLPIGDIEMGDTDESDAGR